MSRRSSSSAHRGPFVAYLASRIVLAFPLLLLLLTMVFLLLRVVPGDPVSATRGPGPSAQTAEQVRRTAGLDRPLAAQYVDYVSGVFRGDLGRTIVSNKPVSSVIAERLPATVELTLAAMLVALALGLGLGTFAARRKDHPPDAAIRLGAIVLYAAPVFWLGLMLQLLFSVKLHWLPSGGRIGAFDEPTRVTGLYVVDSVVTGNLRSLGSTAVHLALPALTLGVAIGGVFVRLVRSNVIRSSRAGFVEAARARGISERTIALRHSLRNALIPIITVVGLWFALLLGGAILTETTFTWPGVGDALLFYLRNRDYPAVQGIVTFFGVLVIAVSLSIDVIAALIDPRIRHR